MLERRSNAGAIHRRGITPPPRGRDLFAAAERLDLEGIVAKRKRDIYAPSIIWYKVKNQAHTQLEGRAELFHPKLP